MPASSLRLRSRSEGVTTDSVVDIGFAVLVEVDYLGIAAALEVEYTVVVPTVFVVTDKETFGVGRKVVLPCTGQTEEDCGVLAVLVGVAEQCIEAMP